MTYEEYMINPIGKANAILSSTIRESVRRDYTNRFNAILLRENGKINYYLYKNTKKNMFMIHIKIPSEVVANFYYDVVIKFTTNENVKDLGRNLAKYKAQFYSNDPAFVYTYANTFLSHDLFIKELSSKMSRKALGTKAKEKNPANLVGYVKSIYFAYLFIQQRGLFSTLRFAGAPELDMNKVMSNIEDADTKIEKRELEGKKKERKNKAKIERSETIRSNATPNNVISKITNKVQTVKRTGTANKSGVIRPKKSNK